MPTASPTTNRGRRILVIYNPVAGRRKLHMLSEILSALEEHGCEPMVMMTTGRGAARALAASASADDYDLVAAAGGDGTINEVANGLAGSGPALGIIPLGTANVLAHEIGMPVGAEDIARVLAEGPIHPVYAGTVDGRRFLIMAGAGLDAHVVAHVNSGLKKRIGKLAYVWETLRLLVRYPLDIYRVTVDGRVFEAASVVVAKGHYYGGTFTCAPEARINIPEFHVCLLHRSGRWNVIRYAFALAQGRLYELPDVEIVKGTTVTIEGYEGEPLQGDGDVIAHLPVTISLAPEPLDLAMPE